MLTRKLRPAVVILDIGLPSSMGSRLHDRFSKLSRHQGPHSLAYGDDAYIEQVTAAGVAGYLLKQSSLADLPRHSTGPCRQDGFQPLHFQAPAWSAPEILAPRRFSGKQLPD